VSLYVAPSHCNNREKRQADVHNVIVAEDTFLKLRQLASSNPDIKFVAVSHSDEASTKKWLEQVGGPGASNLIDVIVDAERQIYAAWGLGTSSLLHVLSPAGLYAVFKLSKGKGIRNRPTESGSRWQTAGSWAVDGTGVVRWGGVAGRADEEPVFEDAIKAVKVGETARL
jgi:hypothetical protein